MAFRYPLQTILKLRQSLERQEEQRLFAIAAVVARLRMEVESLDRKRLASQRRFQQEIAEGRLATELQFATVCDEAAVYARKKKQGELERAESERLEQLKRYSAARQRREILEGLRERQESAYEIEASRREQQSTDEAFLNRSLTYSRE